MNNFYKDINLSMALHPLTGDLPFLTENRAVERSLRHIAEMIPYDIPFEKNLHGQIRELLFEQPSDLTANTLEERIKWAFNKLEPRAKIEDVSVSLNNREDGYDIVVKYSIVSVMGDFEMSFALERIR